MTINQRFELLLKAEKINQKKFGVKAGLSEKTVSNIINGRTKFPKSDFFQAIAKNYPHVNLRWMLLGEGDMYLSKEERARVSAISSDERAKLMRIIGEKDVQLIDKTEQVEAAFQLVMRAAEELEQLVPKEQWKEKRAELDRELAKLKH